MDIDAAGFEIFNGFREAWLVITSILMDNAAYQQYKRFGFRADAQGKRDPGRDYPAWPKPNASFTMI